MRRVSQITLDFAMARLAEDGLRPFPRDPERLVWWEASSDTIDDLATLIPAGQAVITDGVQRYLLGYPLHEAKHIDPGYLVLVERLGGVGLAYEPALDDSRLDSQKPSSRT